MNGNATPLHPLLQRLCMHRDYGINVNLFSLAPLVKSLLNPIPWYSIVAAQCSCSFANVVGSQFPHWNSWLEELA